MTYKIYYLSQMTDIDIQTVATEKAKAIALNNRDSQINLTADTDTYTIFNLDGIVYIGKKIDSKLRFFYPNKTVLTLGNKDGKPIYKIQKFIF